MLQAAIEERCVASAVSRIRRNSSWNDAELSAFISNQAV